MNLLWQGARQHFPFLPETFHFGYVKPCLLQTTTHKSGGGKG
ncbi:hypothetical protein YPPY71_2985 [Yersinia pestis PY-71]|nr:hypothetical protein YPPY71_2985 [Yersinia pestis PY-71]